MAALEEEGYLRQPHTSAGRVPTDKGYRLFVDRLSRIKPLTPAERRAIERFLVGAVDLDDVVHRAVRLLAQLTRQVAVVQYPSLARSKVRHLELVPISTTRIMLVLITDTGRVEQRLVDLPAPVEPELVNDMRQALNDSLGGLPFIDTTKPILDLCEGARPDLRASLTTVATVLLETLAERPDERIALAGTANLTRGGSLDFAGTLRPVLEALEEEVILLKLFGAAREPIIGQGRQMERSGQGDQEVTRVFIGDENEFEDLRATSVVSTGYGPGNTVVGGLGVLGPTRMDYPATIATVRAVARYVGDVLANS
jgi:heat-inducible transcriptional repressor